MRHRLLMTTVILTLLCAVVTPSATAQIIYDEPVSGSSSIIYTSFKTSRDGFDTTVSQMLIPVSGFIPVQDNFEVTFWGAGATNTLSMGSNELKMNGLTDVRLRASHSFQEDHLLASLGLNLPTGATKLEQFDEYPVLLALSYQYTSFPMRRLGEGLGISAVLGAATQLTEQMQATGGVMYEYTGEYEPYKNYEKYNPGDAFSINGALHLDAATTRWQLDMMFTAFGTDQVDGENIFKQAPQFDVRLGFGVPGERRSYSGFIRYLVRGESTEWIQDTTITNQTQIVELDPRKLYGNEFVAGGGARFDFQTNWYLHPMADLRFIQSNDVGLDKSTIFGIGTAIGGTWVSNLLTEVGFKYYVGSADDGAADITGYQLSLSVTVSQ